MTIYSIILLLSIKIFKLSEKISYVFYNHLTLMQKNEINECKYQKMSKKGINYGHFYLSPPLDPRIQNCTDEVT